MFSKKIIMTVFTIAHLILGSVLSDLMPSVITRLVLLVCLGTICGIQLNCIEKSYSKTSRETSKTGDNDNTNHCSTQSIRIEDDFTS